MLNLSAIFNRPPRRALAWFRNKGIKVTGPWQSWWKQANTQAFTVARVTASDVLEAIRAQVQRAVEEGITEAEFQRTLKERLIKTGWWTDVKTGELVPGRDDAPLQARLNANRLRTIYQTNVATSYQAGKHASMKAAAQYFPYWLYESMEDKYVRPAHAALDNLVFRHDDPVWDVIFPPNGFNCFLPGTRVVCDAQLGLRNFYSGEAVEVVTRSGATLRVTANHPVLTATGWKHAHALNDVDHLVRHTRSGDAPLAGVVHHDNAKTEVSELFNALARDGFRVTNVSALNFQGDAQFRQPNVHITGAYAHLMDGIKPSLCERFKQWLLSIGGNGAACAEALVPASAPLRQALASQPVRSQHALHVAPAVAKSLGDRSNAFVVVGGVRGQYLRLKGIVSGARGRLCRSNLSPRQLWALLEPLPLDFFGGASPSHGNAPTPQQRDDRATTDARILRELVHARSVDVAFDQVVSVRKFSYSGHVYDFQTVTGFIVADGLVTHNCRCMVKALSQKQVDDRGLAVADGSKMIVKGTYTKRDGTTVAIRGIKVNGQTVFVDPGWDYNPAKSQTEALEDVADERIAAGQADAADKPGLVARLRAFFKGGKG